MIYTVLRKYLNKPKYNWIVKNVKKFLLYIFMLRHRKFIFIYAHGSWDIYQSISTISKIMIGQQNTIPNKTSNQLLDMEQNYRR